MFQIKSFVEQRLSEQSYGLIGQAFCSAILQELKEYYRLITVLENQVTRENLRGGPPEPKIPEPVYKL